MMRHLCLWAPAGLLAAVPVTAQEAAPAADTSATTVAAAASDAPAALDPFAVDPETVQVPSLTFEITPLNAADFDKYYYFNRADTDFRTALTDLLDCDGLARGLSSGRGWVDTPYPYNTSAAGAAGGIIGNLLVSAIFGSAEIRRLRRVNMRNCMFYKGYQRYGLDKEIWEEFNFEEGLDGVSEEARIGFLRQQARIASGPRPQQEALGQ
jgi:hypothetical protein